MGSTDGSFKIRISGRTCQKLHLCVCEDHFEENVELNYHPPIDDTTEEEKDEIIHHAPNEIQNDGKLIFHNTAKDERFHEQLDPATEEKNPKGSPEEYEENPSGISWENSETKEEIQDVDFKMCQPKKELFQDYTDPLAVCDVKLDNKEIESDNKSDTTKNESDTKIKTKKKKKPSKVGPKQCTICGKTFKDKSSLTQHTKFVHEKAKTELCPECGKSFMKKDNLMR